MSLGEEYETYLLRVFSLDTSETKIAARYSTVADPVEGPGGLVPSLFLDQTEARRFENNFFGDCPPPLSQSLDDRPPPLISRSGSRHCSKRSPFTIFRTKESTVNSIKLLKFRCCKWQMDLNLTKWRPRLTLTLAEENFTYKYHHIVLPCLPVYFFRLNSQRPRDTLVRRWNA